MSKIRCKHCNDIIESKHRHDFKYCKCGAVFIDGGSDYLRTGFPSHPPEDHYEVILDDTKHPEPVKDDAKYYE